MWKSTLNVPIFNRISYNCPVLTDNTDMPIYEYQCVSCGHELEKLQRISEAPLTDCPDCGESKLQRLVSAAGFRLKGSGWYETDFKKGKQKNLHGADNASKESSKKPATETAKPAEAKKSEAKAASASSDAA